MNQYTIYCTEEQTKKALELGARIINYPIQCSPYAVPKFEKQLKSGRWIAYIIPTAEQMISWLESLGSIEEITVCKTGMWIWGKNHTLIDGSSNYSSRQESTLAAIDAALEYLNSKQ